jgi:phosphatidylserine/phosphatidylglycerophosphate/cardiolipin synthase-like enzyme
MYDVIVGKEYPAKVIPLIESAKSTIKIVVFDWRWYGADPGASVQLFNQAIIRASRRGVQIKAIANANDVITILNKHGIQAKKIITKKLMHTKLMIIDDSLFIIGSHNYTMSAFHLNEELSVCIFGVGGCARMLTYFDNLWTRNL